MFPIFDYRAGLLGLLGVAGGSEVVPDFVPVVVGVAFYVYKYFQDGNSSMHDCKHFLRTHFKALDKWVLEREHSWRSASTRRRVTFARVLSEVREFDISLSGA